MMVRNHVVGIQAYFFIAKTNQRYANSLYYNEYMNDSSTLALALFSSSS